MLTLAAGGRPNHGSRVACFQADCGMGRAGIEPATLGLKQARAISGRLGWSRESRSRSGFSDSVEGRRLGSSLPVSLSPRCHPGGAMNALELVPATHDPALRALLERGLAQARAREAAERVEAPPEPVETRSSTPPSPPRSLGLASDRACVESNLARKGLWRSGTSGGELVRLLDATDQLGMVQRIDAGPPLGALAFDVIVWACTRWRELGQAGERHVPFTLEAMATDLGWRKGGGAASELARVLDALRTATFRARVYNARLQETHVDTFGLIDRWERGECHQAGKSARPGFIALGDWLHEQLARDHVTYLSWAEMRSLRSGTARRLLAYLDAERFSGPRWLRTVDESLFTTLGITAARPFHQRATLRRAAAEITETPNRYTSVALAPGERRGEHVLIAKRASTGPTRPARNWGRSCDGPGQSRR